MGENGDLHATVSWMSNLKYAQFVHDKHSFLDYSILWHKHFPKLLVSTQFIHFSQLAITNRTCLKCTYPPHNCPCTWNFPIKMLPKQTLGSNNRVIFLITLNSKETMLCTLLLHITVTLNGGSLVHKCWMSWYASLQ